MGKQPAVIIIARYVLFPIGYFAAELELISNPGTVHASIKLTAIGWLQLKSLMILRCHMAGGYSVRP